MNKEEQRVTILSTLQNFDEQNPARIVHLAIALDNDIVHYERKKWNLINLAFSLLLELEQEKLVKNLCKPPVPITSENKEMIINMSQWVLTTKYKGI
ncbi:MAG: hypothetical protein ACYDH2_13995 [Anaerolineaceae bacterium]